MSLFNSYAECEEKNESESGMDKFPRLWYRYFLLQKGILDSRRVYTNTDTLKKLLKLYYWKRNKNKPIRFFKR